MKKEIVDVEIERLVKCWADANGRAWETVGRPGPSFCAVHLDDQDYVDNCWRDHHAQIEADEATAVEAFWAALRTAPVWLRMSRPWLKEAWEQAFVDARQGVYVGHSCMPFVEDVYKRLEL